MKNKHIVTTIVFAFVAIISLFIVLGGEKKDSAGIDTEKYAASINGELLERGAVKDKAKASEHFFAWANQNVDRSTLEKDALERLIEYEITVKYAEKQNISVSEDRLQKRYNDALGDKKEKDLLAQIKEMYGLSKEQYLENLRFEILKELVQEDVEMPYKEWIEREKERAKIERY